MKIGFYAGNLIPFHASTLDERPLGGMETGVIRLSEALAERGHDVCVYTAQQNPRSSKVKYFYLPEIEKQEPLDVFVAVRDWIPIFYNVVSKKRFFWTGDSYDQFPNFGLGDKRVENRLDAFLAVSEWQAEEISTRSGFSKKKTRIVRNGIHLPYFSGQEKRARRRLIYSSTPYRGLAHVPALFSELRKKFPDTELHVFSSMQIYDQTNPQFDQLKKQLTELAGITVHSSVNQGDLAREMMRSAILFYPCHFEETSCITAMEAMASGTVVLSSALGALPETVGDAGVLIPGRPETPEYFQKFFQAAERLLSDDDYFETLSQNGKKKSPQMSWTKVAEDFEKISNEVV